MSNPFLDYAEEIETRSEARAHRRKLSAQQRAQKKALAERDYLFRDWQKWHKKRRNELLSGKWSKEAQALADFVEHMALSDGKELVEQIKNGPWRNTDRDTRFLVQIMVAHSIIYLREKSNLEPFDDPLPGDKPNASLIIRELLA